EGASSVSTNDPDRVSAVETKRLVQQAMDAFSFCPQFSYPDLQCVDSNLVSMFSRPVLKSAVESNQGKYLPPYPLIADIYLAKNNVVSHGSLTAAWITHTALYSSLCGLMMKQCVVKKIVRMDHSIKSRKRLKNWEGNGRRENLVDAKMSLLLQNKIGRIIGTCLMSSKIIEETMQLLTEVKEQFQPSGDCFLVSENAFAVANVDQQVKRLREFQLQRRHFDDRELQPLRSHLQTLQE
ncbi:hypothetical protein PHMEG_00013028, partial [Phytophthora megakarya]